MDLVLSQLNLELKEIRDHIVFLDGLKNEISPASNSFTYLSSSARKKYDYNSIIISLYGILESYIQKFIIEYFSQIEDSIFEYEMLNESLRDNHFQKSLNLITKVIENRFQQYSHLKGETLLENLNNCILRIKPFKINKEAFFINAGNLKHSKTCEIFKSLGINLDQEIRAYDGFKIRSENLFNRQDEIVDRRNEIAHGAISQIMDNSEIIPFIEYQEVYFSAVNKLLKDKLENDINVYKKTEFSNEIPNTTVYKGNIVGIIAGATLNLALNSEVIIERASEKTILAKIINIKSFPKSNDITIKVDINIRDNCKFYQYDKQSYEAHKIPKV